MVFGLAISGTECMWHRQSLGYVFRLCGAMVQGGVLMSGKLGFCSEEYLHKSQKVWRST